MHICMRIVLAYTSIYSVCASLIYTNICLYYTWLCRVPKALKGDLATHWGIRDEEGYILNNDGTRYSVLYY